MTATTRSTSGDAPGGAPGAGPGGFAGHSGARPVPAVSTRGPVAHSVRHLLGAQALLAVWLWAVVVAIAVVLTVVLDRAGRVEASTWETLDQGPRWFLFAMGIVGVAGWFTAHVANGMTRRSFTVILGATTALTAVGYAAVTTLGFVVERAVFAARGWSTDLRSEHLFTATDQLGLVATENLVMLLVYGASGMLVGAVYHRAGGWWGTLALPLTVGPVLLAEGLVGAGWLGTVLGSAVAPDRLPAGVVAGACLGLAAVLMGATHAVLRAAPLSATTG